MDNIYRSPCKAWVVKVVVSLLTRITSCIPFDICRSLTAGSLCLSISPQCDLLKAFAGIRAKAISLIDDPSFINGDDE